ncbi:hypothetical protein N7462_008878 [Penicillium macrosclerotiorum]|uniref:uncharacterized protein n=1 Tax=Penicillium macrosclerotiorum TaxID=303699 RepID=UPI00254783D5|nr:uncharacterized protein N7462_008878 [Penicillium macrosclerotiorum]KAJ5675981.1 hypothetical protein N7462_008878 [Penicillium macrosclerotiorum]
MIMSIRSFLILAGAATVAADQHIADSPFLNQFIVDSGYVSISTAGSDATHTTYIAKCDNSGTDVCTLPSAGATIVMGPSYVGCSYTDPSEPLSSSVGCKYINAGSSVLCTMYQSGQSGTYVATFSQTETLPASAVALGFNAPTGTGTNSKQTSEASAGSAATMTSGAATTADSGASSTKSSTTNESASKTGSAASETKTGGAAKVAELVFVAVGAAIVGGIALVM